MDRVAAAALIIGNMIPFLLSVIVQVKFPRWVKLALSIAICTAAGMLTLYAAGGLNWASWSSQNLLITIGLIFGASQALYASYVKGSPVMTVINEATSY